MPSKVDSRSSAGSRSKKKRESLFCPFLGFKDDPSTALAYPAGHNYCFKSNPISSVSLEHQRKSCLTETYLECPVFQKESAGPLPKGLRGDHVSRIAPVKWVPFVALAAVILIALAALILIGIIPIRGFSAPYTVIMLDTKTPQAAYTSLPTTVLTRTPSPKPTVLPTQTPTMITLNNLSPRMVGTPFGSSPKLVIHRVIEGEGFILLAEKFGTTAEAIKAINFDLPESLWVNTILVIPIDTDDVTDLPRFSAVEVRAEGMTIEAYAERNALDVELIKRYNDLPAGYALKLGEWLIIPMSEE